MLSSGTNSLRNTRQPAPASSPITNATDVATDRALAPRQETATPQAAVPATDTQWESVIDLATD
jgi:hypothetical protein